MAWYRRSRFVHEAFKRLNSKLFPSTSSSVQSPALKFSANSFALHCNRYKSYGVLGTTNSIKFGNISGFKLGNSHGFIHNQSSSYFTGAFRRHYSINNNQVNNHFNPRKYKAWCHNNQQQSLWGRNNHILKKVVSCSVVMAVCYGISEVVPYTKRKHVVLISRNFEKTVGEFLVEHEKKKYEGKILPDIHPDSVRVRMISTKICEAVQRGHSRKEKILSLLSPLLLCLVRKEWIEKTRKKAEKQGAKANREKGIKWEVVVVDEPILNAYCMPGGKIFVFTGLIKHFDSDVELATVIGHEVGHVVARHMAEACTREIWLRALKLILNLVLIPYYVNGMSNLFIRLPISRKMEIEADYIGLLLMASAGYDPRTVPQVYEKLGKISGRSPTLEYLSTHPCGKTRAQLLARAHIMEEAVDIYQEVVARRAIEGFQ